MAGEGITYRLMTVDDIPQVQLVERKCFTTPWSRSIFISEVTRNDNAVYLVAEVGELIVGYVGIWIILDEGHITNIGVHPDFQRQGIGRGLMDHITVAATLRGVTAMTLEVRVSNYAAQALYNQLGFVPSGIRKQYYQDDKEDALIMWRELGEDWTNLGD